MRALRPFAADPAASPALVGHELLEEPASFDGYLVVARGELDIASAFSLRDKLHGAAASGVQRILLDLTDVTFMDSLSMAAVVATQRRLGEDGRLAVVATHPYVLLIFEAGGIDSVVDVFRTRDAAEAYLRA
jgi:anti-sigma B factor antagonist